MVLAVHSYQAGTLAFHGDPGEKQHFPAARRAAPGAISWWAAGDPGAFREVIVLY